MNCLIKKHFSIFNKLFNFFLTFHLKNNKKSLYKQCVKKLSKCKKIMEKIKHVPVMYKEVLENAPEIVSLAMDGTVGHGGHSSLLLDKFTGMKLVAVDRDPNIIKIAQSNLSKYADSIKFVRESYGELDSILQDKKVDLFLLDLWVNMEHFKDASRWFSIKKDGPLDMRFDTNQKTTALYILKNYRQDQLEEILSKWWDFKWKLLQDIVRTIVKWRHNLKTTFDLKNLLKTINLSEKKIAVVFQSLRIEVNQELEQLEMFLDKFTDYLNSWWRCQIITYHSIEDRLVKNRFKELDKNWFKNLTKKVIFPSKEEIEHNKASRSAKLRIIEKL